MIKSSGYPGWNVHDWNLLPFDFSSCIHFPFDAVDQTLALSSLTEARYFPLVSQQSETTSLTCPDPWNKFSFYQVNCARTWHLDALTIAIGACKTHEWSWGLPSRKTWDSQSQHQIHWYHFLMKWPNFFQIEAGIWLV